MKTSAIFGSMKTVFISLVVAAVFIAMSGCANMSGSVGVGGDGENVIFGGLLDDGSDPQDDGPANPGNPIDPRVPGGEEPGPCLGIETDFDEGEVNPIDDFKDLQFSFDSDVDTETAGDNIQVQDEEGSGIAATELRWLDARTLYVRGSFAYGTVYSVNFSTGLQSQAGDELCSDASYDIRTPGAPFDIDLSADNNDDLFIGSWRYNAPNGGGFIFLGEELYNELGRLDYDLYFGPYPSLLPFEPAGYDRRGTASANLGDINGDGRADYVMLAQSTETFIWEVLLYDNGAHVATFLSGWGGNPWEISAVIPTVLGDLDGDGIREFMLIEDINPDGGDVLRNLALMKGMDYSGEVPIVDYLGIGETNNATAVATGNFNGDAWNDLAIATMSSVDGTGQVRIYSGVADLADIVDSPYATIAIGADEANMGISIAAGDINADGRDELIVGMPNTADIGYVHVFNGQNLNGVLSMADSTFFINSGGSTLFGYDVAAGSVATPLNPDLLVSDISAATGEPAQGAVYLFSNASLAAAVDTPASEHLAAINADAFFLNDVAGDGAGSEEFGRKILLENFDNDDQGLQDVFITGMRRRDMGGWFLDDADFGCVFLGRTSLTGGASVSCIANADAYIDIPTPSPTLYLPLAF